MSETVGICVGSQLPNRAKAAEKKKNTVPMVATQTRIKAVIDRAESSQLYCWLALELTRRRRASRLPCFEQGSCGRQVIPDEATIPARLNFRNRNFSGSL